ncbi:MAG: hypothetical protein Q9213_006954 [Squamulea squamosa]
MTHSMQEETTAKSKTNLWESAILTAQNDLPPDLRDLLTSTEDTTAILNSISQAAQARQAEAQKNQLKIPIKSRKTIVVRDVWGKVLGWVKRFQTIGDIAIQADAGYASLPWALVRLILTAAIAENETYAQILGGMEFVSGLIVQYAVVEQIYASDTAELNNQLQKSLMELYVSLLRYLVRSIEYFGYNRRKRAFSGIKKGMDDEVNQLQRKINEAKARVDADASMVHHDLTQSGIDILARQQQSLSAKGNQILKSQMAIEERQNHISATQEYQAEQGRVIEEVLESWQRPLDLISEQILDVHNEVDHSQATRISNWLSTVRVDVHHTAVRDGRLPSSGKWLLQHPTYRDWTNPSKSSVLWMHGLLGTGKTKLTSTVIDEAQIELSQQNDNARLAYFYCTRNKAGSENEMDLPSGSEPVAIFRSLLKQLAKPGKSDKFDVTVTDKYYQLKADVDEPRQLTLPECIELIISIAASQAMTIIIDALDECRSAKVHDLIKGLDEIVLHSPKKVKIFMSTRPVSTVVDNLRDKHYASLELDAGQNSDDVSNFIKYELGSRVKEKQLLHGNVSEDLQQDILSSLTRRAGSMFWYASLQLNLLCDPTAEQDERSIRAKLTELPATLRETYTGIIHEITSSKNSESSRDIAQNTLKWLLCAQEPLPCHSFLEAIPSAHGQNLDAERVSSICRSLVSRDKENDRFEFAHLSVREHLEQEEQYNPSECHLVAAESCLRAVESFYRSSAMNRLIPDSAKAFSRYASLYWPFHFQRIDFRHTDDRRERLKSKLKTLLVRGRDVSPIFEHWISHVESMAVGASDASDYVSSLESLRAVPATPLFAASIFGFADLIKQYRLIGYDLEQSNVHQQSALCLAAENNQLETVKAFLEDIPRAKVPSLDVNQVNISAVAQFGEHDPSSPPKVTCFATALQAAAYKGNVPIARYLLEKGARIDLMAGYFGNALQAASLNGHVELVKLFLDYGAEPNSQGGFWGNALQAAAYSGNLATVSALIEYGALVLMPGGHYGTAFMAGVESRSKEVVELLLNYSKDNKEQINKASKYYGSPLQRAAELDCYNIVELLVTEKADMNVQSTADTAKSQLIHSSALAAAAWGGHSKIVSILLANGAQADVGHQGEELHLLHQAASRGMLALAEYCIDTCGCDVDMVTNQLPAYVASGTMTPLSFACIEGQTQVAQFLLSKGASVEFEGDNFSTLGLAARRGHVALLQLLLESSESRQEANVHSSFVNRATPELELTPLYEAAQVGSVESVRLLLDHGAGFRANRQGANPIHVAVAEHKLRVVKMLADRAASSERDGQRPIDALDAHGSPPLFYAIVQDDPHVLRVLLTSGADITILGTAGTSVLHVAARLNRVQILRELFAFQDSKLIQSQLDLADYAGHIPLVEALATNSYSAAVFLLEQGAQWPDNEHQIRVLHEAVLDDDSRVREQISTFNGFPAQLHAFLGSVDDAGKTALHVAAEFGRNETLELFLQHGAKLDADDNCRNTPLIQAIIKGHDRCARTLLDFAHKTDKQPRHFIDHCNQYSNTALHEAVICRRTSAIQLLIQSGADVTVPSQDNKTALHLVLLNATNADADQQLAILVVDELLRKVQADGGIQPFIDSCTNTGATALSLACERQMHKVARTLLNYGADCFIPNHEGASPLHIAVQHGSVELTETMLGHLYEKHGQDSVQRLMDHRNAQGMTALNEACRIGNSELVELLLGKYKADYTLAGNKGGAFPEYTPLHSAVWGGSSSLVQRLLKCVALDTDFTRKQALLDAYESKNGSNRTALLYATDTQRVDIVEMLLAAGADYLLADKAECTALHKSVSNNDMASTRALLNLATRDTKKRRTRFLNHRNYYGKTALMDAAERDLAPMIKSLLQLVETDYTVQDLKGFTALHWGAWRDKRSGIKMLLEMTSQDGTDNGTRFRDFINHRAHQNGISALFDAAAVGHAEMTKMLLHYGAEYDTFDDAGHHPLYFSVKKDFFDVVEVYLDFVSRAGDHAKLTRFVTARQPKSGLTIYELVDREGSTRMQRLFSKFPLETAGA